MERLNVRLDFCVKIYLILAFVEIFSHFHSVPLEIFEWILFLKISVHLQTSQQASFTGAHVVGPTS